MKPGSKREKDHKLDIFQSAQLIKQEQEAVAQAAKIMNAYRKVEDLQSHEIAKPKEKKPISKKPDSQYANKVKQTLRELNANRHKEQKEIKNTKIQFKSEKSSAERHLINAACKKVFKLMARKCQNHLRTSLQQIAASSEKSSISDREIRLWKLQRLFAGWNYEAMLSKIEKARIQKESSEKQAKMIRLADDFRYFNLVKKSLQGWKLFTLKAIKRRKIEQEERNLQIKEILQQKDQPAPEIKTQVQKNEQLQNKLRGFLTNLQGQIQSKDKRLNTIKQKTEYSQLHPKQNHSHQESLEEENSRSHEEQAAAAQPEENLAQNRQSPARNSGPLSNDELEKRRQELARKAKARKQALQKLKKQKNLQKKKEEQERIKIQKEIEEEQKKARQEQYRRFLKQKKDQQQWQKREKQLTDQADQFNRLRIMNFYGWAHWRKLKEVNANNFHFLTDILTKIVLRQKLSLLIEGINKEGAKNLVKAEEKADKVYRRKLMKKSVKGFSQQRKQQLQLKEQFDARHEVHTLKIFFRAWIGIRADLQLENFEWQRPRLKRAECLYAMTLMQKGMQSLRLNREREVQQRNIEQHKAKIKQKVQLIVEEKPTIDYDEFL